MDKEHSLGVCLSLYLELFLCSVEQPNKEADELLAQLMLMKYLFLAVFEKMKLFSGTELGVLHLAPYECRFALNGMILLSYL